MTRVFGFQACLECHMVEFRKQVQETAGKCGASHYILILSGAMRISFSISKSMNETWMLSQLGQKDEPVETTQDAE